MIFGRRRGNFALTKLVLALCIAFPFSKAIADPGPPPALGYASFVCWNYPQLPQLRAWKETESIIATTLAESYPALHEFQREENATPAQLKDLLRTLPGSPDHLTIVYLAAHQSPGGEWYFPDRSVVDWGTLMADLPKLQSPNRVVLLDCCYAESASLWPDWPQKIAPACFFASPANRPTPDLFVFWRRPVDWGALFPGAVLWLQQHHYNDSDERISFFGLVWLEAWVSESSHPRNLNEWNHLAQTMTQITRRTSAQIHATAMSDINSNFPTSLY